MIPLTSLRHLARRIFLVAALVVGLFALTAGVKVGAAAGSSTYDTADFAYDGPVDVAQRLMVAAADVVVPIDWVDNAVFPAPQTDGHLHDSSTDLVAPNGIPGVRVPGGVAEQATDAASLAARADVEAGTQIWRVGTTGRSKAADAQFWSPEHRSTPGFADRYGVPTENVLNADFIESAVVPPGTPFVTRPAPGVGTNLGGGIEVVVPEGAVRMCGFSVVGGC